MGLNFVSIYLVRLHFLGKVLSVERANKTTENGKHQEAAARSVKQSSSLAKDATVTRDLNAGSKLGSFPTSEPIAERLGVDYPFPPHLEYVSHVHLLFFNYQTCTCKIACKISFYTIWRHMPYGQLSQTK